MEDQKIIDLYWQRSEQAIMETDRKYGGYCFSVAYNILANREDAEESVSDTYLAAWRAMPPKRPGILSSFLERLPAICPLTGGAEDRHRSGAVERFLLCWKNWNTVFPARRVWRLLCSGRN